MPAQPPTAATTPQRPSSAPRPAEPAVVTLASSSAMWSLPPREEQVSRIDYVRALLPTQRWFDELGSDRVRELARQVQVLERDDGETLFTTGAPTGPLLLVTAGNAHIDRPGAFPFDLVVGEGAMLGVLSALYGEPRLATARARGPLEAFALAPSLARALAREFVTFRHMIEKAAVQHATALLRHLSPALRSLSAVAQERVLGAIEYLTVDDGTLLMLESTPVRALHLVAAGAIERFGEGVPAGTVTRLGAGSLVGADALRDEALARSTVRAAGPTLLARIDRAAYRALVAEFPGVREALHDGAGN
jgi:CRP-like cAMP-binding protein